MKTSRRSSAIHSRAPRRGPFAPTLIISILVLAVLTSGRADDWPQWLGPTRDAIWHETGIIESFPPDGTPVRWRANLGAGYSGPAVANGRVYVMDRQLPGGSASPANPFEPGTSTGLERVHCFNERDGKLLWTHKYECVYTVSYPAGPRVTPAVADGKVYTLGAEGNLFCLDATNGSPVWSREFKPLFGVKAPMWGFAGHPLVDGNRVICIAAGNGSTVVAFHKDTGQELWRALSAAEPGYSAPMIIEAGGTRQLIVWHPEGASSFDPVTGKSFWSVPFTGRSGLTVATPRKAGDLLFFTSFYDGSLMVRLDPDKPAASLLWRTPKGGDERRTTHLNSIIPTPFYEDGVIYGICSYGQLRCLKAETGERVWETLEVTTSGAPVRWGNAFIVKNGSRFFLFNEKGDLIIARLSPSGYQEVSRTHLLDPVNKDPGRAVVWSHPAFANRKVYARNDRELICADLAAAP
jgi:outer membrane protein assembly factor BamB